MTWNDLRKTIKPSKRALILAAADRAFTWALRGVLFLLLAAI